MQESAIPLGISPDNVGILTLSLNAATIQSVFLRRPVSLRINYQYGKLWKQSISIATTRDSFSNPPGTSYMKVAQEIWQQKTP